MMNKLWKKVFKGQLLLKGSIDNFGQIDLFVDLTLLNIFANNSLSVSIIIFKIITKNCKISIKSSIQGYYTWKTSYPLRLKISGQVDLDLINTLTSCLICSKCWSFWDISQKLHFTLCSIFSHDGHVFWRNKK